MDLTGRVIAFRRLYRETFQWILIAGGTRSVVIAMGGRFPMLLMGQVLAGHVHLRAAVTTEAEALASVRQHRPDLLLCSDELESGSIVTCCQSALQEVPRMRVLMILSQRQSALALRALDRRLDAVVLEDDLGADEAPLRAAFIAVMRGQRYRSPSLRAMGGLEAPSEEEPRNPGEIPLTPREEEILKLMVRGLKDRQIAEALGLSHETTRTYVKTVRRKLGGGSRLEIAARRLSF